MSSRALSAGPRAQLLLQLLLVILMIGVGSLVQNIHLRAVLFFCLGLSSLLVFIVPYDRAIQVFFLYLGIEGFAKIMTGYNPVVHVGADLLVCALSARYVLTGILRGRIIAAPLPPLTLFFLLHFAWFLIAAANPFALSLVASLAAAKMYVTMPLLFFFGYYLTTSRSRIDRFISPWIVVGIIQAATSLYQAARGPSSVLGLSPLYAVQLAKFKGYAFRPFGLTNQPGEPSIYLYMISPMILYLFLQSRSLLVRLGLLGLLGASTLALIFCQVRSALLKGIIGLVCYLGICLRAASGSAARSFRRIKSPLMSFVVLASVVLAVAVPRYLHQMSAHSTDAKMAVNRSLSLFDPSKSASARSGALERFLRYASEAPLGAGLSRTGAAAGKFEDEIQRSPYFKAGFFSDNFWVATVVDLGIPGTLLLTLLVFLILGRGAFQMSQLQDPGLRLANGALFSALFAIVVGFYGAEAILYNPEAAFFWFFSGVMLRLPELDASLSSSSEAIRLQENLSS